MSQEEKKIIVLKYWPSKYPGRATERQVTFLNSLLSQGHLFESDFINYEYIDTTMLLFQRADELIKLGLSRQEQAKAKREEIIKFKIIEEIKRGGVIGNRNDVALDRAIVAEGKTCAGTLVDLTTLKAPDIAALMNIYDLGGFFRKYAGRIVEKQLGVLIAEIVLSILNLRKCRSKYIGRINKSANDNPKLTTTLRKWIMNDDPKTLDGGSHNATYPRPPPEGIEQDEQEVDEFSDMEVENE